MRSFSVLWSENKAGSVIYPSASKPIPRDTMTLVNDDLIQSLYDECGLPKQTSRVRIEQVLELIKKALESGGRIPSFPWSFLPCRRLYFIHSEIYDPFQ